MRLTKQIARTLKRALLGILLLLFSTGVLYAAERRDAPSGWIRVQSKASLVHLASVDSLEITKGGTQAAKLMLDALENKRLESAVSANRLYDRLIPQENFGGDYTALQWFSQYLVATQAEREKLLGDKFVSSYFQFLADNDFALLKEYLQRKYKLGEFADRNTEVGRKREAFLEDFIRFNNPRREEWEKTSKIIRALNLKPGDRVADIGSGPGYFSFKFAERVGDRGRVYAIDTVENHLNYVGRVSKEYGIKNIDLIPTDGETIGLTDNRVDVAFMCSLYHVLYTISQEKALDKFIESIEQSLTPDGTLVIVDNALVEDRKVPYQGPYIVKDLIVAQLKYYGFQLIEEHAFIPQRYVLVFKKG